MIRRIVRNAANVKSMYSRSSESPLSPSPVDPSPNPWSSTRQNARKIWYDTILMGT